MEVWRLPLRHYGSFVAMIPAPLGIGRVELEDGSWVQGFLCEPWASWRGGHLALRRLACRSPARLVVLRTVYCAAPVWRGKWMPYTHAEHLLHHCRHSHAAPLIDRLQDSLRHCDRLHALFSIR